jgi:pimeloyl-ACP methyl ester carboxylesterase
MLHAGVANLRMWDGQVPALAPHYQVIRFDTRGFGLSETEDVEFSDRADVGAVLDHLGAQSAHLLGASRSGAIALDFALEFPERVDALIIASGGIGGYEPEIDDATLSLFAEAERRSEALDWDWLTAFETAYWVDGPGQSPDRVDPSIRRRVEEWIGSNYRAEKVAGRPRSLEPAAAGRLGEVESPTLVVVGDLDETLVIEESKMLASQIPDARLEVFAGAAHMLNLEQPERFNRTVLAFLVGSEEERRV